MTKINISVTNPELEKLDNMKKETGLDRGEIIRRAIDEYIEKYDMKKG